MGNIVSMGNGGRSNFRYGRRPTFAPLVQWVLSARIGPSAWAPDKGKREPKKKGRRTDHPSHLSWRR